MKVLSKLEEIAYALVPANRKDTQFFHVAAIFQRNKILSIGQNSFKTHPLAQKWGHKGNFTHAELKAAINYATNDFNNVSMAVLRIDRRNLLAMSRPCSCCESFLLDSGIRRVFYTNEKGEWEKL